MALTVLICIIPPIQALVTYTPEAKISTPEP
jgi:hypothetical protein